MNLPQDQLAKYIRDVPDFPKPGIMFKDITPLLADPAALTAAVELLAAPFRDKQIEAVVGIESRGFIFAAAVARELSAGFIPVRKPGKLPYKTSQVTYELEYGTDSVEIHLDAIKPGQKVLMMDDLLATGGTMKASCDLVTSLGGDITAIAFLIELGFLKGHDKLKDYELVSIIHYD